MIEKSIHDIFFIRLNLQYLLDSPFYIINRPKKLKKFYLVFYDMFSKNMYNFKRYFKLILVIFMSFLKTLFLAVMYDLTIKI